MITILATICALANASDCRELTVTTSDFSQVSITACLVGAPQLAEWMKQHPADRLAGWKCVVGERRRGA